jgi:hypothetical protein
VSGYQSFAVIGNANTTYYTIVHQTANEWEVGIGTYTSSGTTLSRDTVLASSNSGSLVNFSAGTKFVFCDYPAGRAVYLDTATNATLPNLTLSGNLTFSSTAQRIVADMSNATVTDRFGFVTSTANSSTIVSAYPSGTGSSSAFRTHSSADPTNSSWFQFASTSTDNRINSSINGTGTYLPITFFTGGSERMRLDTSGNLGIGTSSPVGRVDSVSNASSAFTARASTTGANQTATVLNVYNSDASLFALAQYNAVQHIWGYAGATEGMRLNASGNLGIGTSSPGQRLDVRGNLALSAASATVNGFQEISFPAGIYGKAAIRGISIGTTDAGALAFLTAPAGDIPTERARLDSSGNLGLGVTPSAWTGGGNIQTVAGGIVTSSSGYASYSANAYFGTGAFRYVGTAPATMIRHDNGAINFQIAPSGTAGNAISFTQAMTLDASGQWLLGGTSLDNPQSWGRIAQVINSGSNGAAISVKDANNEFNIATYNSALIIADGVTERMRLDSSGNLGIGTTPSAWRSGARALQIGANGYVSLFEQGNGAANLAFAAYESATNTFAYRTTGDPPTLYSQISGTHLWSNAAAGTANNTFTFTERMRLDSSGNLGIGTSSPAQRLDVTGAGNSVQARFGAVAGRGLTIGTAVIAGTNDAGVIFNAPITEGTLIFQTNSTERARITSGGALLVGATSNFGAADDRLQVDTATASARSGIFRNNTSTTDTVGVWNSATTGDNLFIQFYTEAGASVRGSITYNRAGGLVAYNVTSDYRAKDIIGPVQDSGAIIDALKVYEGQMKGATQSRPMLIAHEAQEHAPYAVTGEKDAVNEDGTPKYQQMDVSALVPLLLAEIQSLRARVAQLETK